MIRTEPEIPQETSVENTEIAIIGMSCRYPGDVRSPQEFMDFLLGGGDGIVDVPADRWDSEAYYDADKEKPARMYVKRGGFIKNIEQFDPQFFNISPKEAPHIDPQHRWLLELTQELLENAGINASDLRGSDSAVFIGQFMHDYEQIQLDSMSRSMMSSHSATGPSMTLTAARISYTYDLIGPSVTLDTACSSSLVALDMACKAVINGDSKLAIAGGVNILLRPELTMSICKASMLSPDGKCKSFDASANGYVRSEGAGLVLVKSLKDALQDGDNILAVIKATGVNQDGQTNGITVPNGDSQKKLLDRSLARAKILPSEIQYAEAHGTGTAVGDPIEVNALGDVLGDRPQGASRCVIGSVKSNIGHSEAAAGVAGLIKTVMAMNAGVIPQNIHYHNTNPAIDLKKLNLEIASKTTPWPDTSGEPRRAIVNSFGFGGTNANVILEQAPALQRGGAHQKPSVNSDVKLLLISSKTQNGLKEQATAYARKLEQLAEAQGEDEALLHDICYSAALRRDHYKNRLAVTGTSAKEMMQGLEDFIAGRPSSRYVSSSINLGTGSEMSFVFSGMGTTWAGMGRELYQTEPVFKQTMDRCDEALRELGGWSLLEAVFDETDPERIHQTYLAQPAIFATQVALVELLKSWGITPSCIVGHSAGEVAAAYVAGVYTFEDAIKVIYHRSRLQHTTEGMGRMLAVALTEDSVKPYLAGRDHLISVAAINSEDALTLSGDEKALTEIAEKLDEQGIFARFLNVGVPYHSPAMDQLKEPLVEELRGIKVSPPRIPLYSTVSGKLTAPGDWTADYWPNNVREPVYFKAAIDEIASTGVHAFVEVAPHTALSSSIAKNVAQRTDAGVVVGTMKRGQDSVLMLSQTLAWLHVTGMPVDWSILYPNGGNFVQLPNYAWQHSAYWHESDEARQRRLKNISQRGGVTEAGHPLAGGKLNSTTPFWQQAIDVQDLSYLEGHQVEDEIVYPGAAYIEMALFIASQTFKTTTFTIEDIQFKKALFLDKEKPTIIETIYHPTTYRYTISAVEQQTQDWTSFSEGTIREIPKQASARRVSFEDIKSRMPNTLEKEAFYQHCSKLGLTYKNHFQAVEHAWYDDRSALVDIQLSPEVARTAEDYLLHPCILDAAFQSFFPTVERGYLPVRISEFNYYQRPGAHLYSHLVITYKDELEVRGDFTLFNADGNVSIEIKGVELKATGTNTSANGESVLYDYEWVLERVPAQDAESSSAAPQEGEQWLILADSGGVGEELATYLREQGQSVHVVMQSSNAGASSRGPVVGSSPEELQSALNALHHGCRAIVYLWSLDVPPIDQRSSEEVMKDCEATTVIPLHLAQALAKTEWRKAPKLVFASRAAHALNAEDALPQPPQSALWGFARVLASEHPEYDVALIDLPDGIESEIVGQLCNEITSTNYEQEVALRKSGRYAHRLRNLQKAQLEEYIANEASASESCAFEVVKAAKSGSESHTLLQQVLPPALEEGMVSIEVTYAGVDKHSLSHLRSRAVDSPSKDARGEMEALDCVGIVTGIGGGVTHVAIGDSVLALGIPSWASEVQAQSQMVVKLPVGMTMEEASSIPSGFVTAYYALVNLADLRSGETVLIHEAADPVGLAAIQLARSLGANVIATAKTNQKREYLRTLGVSDVYDNTNFDFVDAIKANRQTVDVVLNSLTGQVVDRTVFLMPAMGRFIEIGNTAQDTQPILPQQLFNKGISWHLVRLKDLLQRRPKVASEILTRAVELFESSDLRTLPVRVHPVSDASRAISDASSEDSIGKVVLNFKTPNLKVSKGILEKAVKPARTYMVTGGLGGLGLEVMRWLAESGAESIVLLGRRPPDKAAEVAIEECASKRVHITAMQADVTNGDDVQRVIHTIQENLPPLAGIVHSAGVLEDGTIGQQSAEAFSKVLSPKVKGAWNLHLMTQHQQLDFFICFSSIAAVVGWAGQSNYAAANAFMDGLAFHRHALGQPALSINWGPWGESGMAASLDDREIQRMKDAGMTALTTTTAMPAMDALLKYRLPQAGVFDLNWSLILKQYPDPRKKTVFKPFIGLELASSSEDFIESLFSSSEDGRMNMLLEKVTEIMADVIGVDQSDSLDKHANVSDYGLNSLMSMDFRNRLQAALKCNLPSTLTLKYPTISTMAKFILNECLDMSDTSYQKLSAVNEGQTVKVVI